MLRDRNLRKTFTRLSDYGVRLFLDGRPVTPRQLSLKLVRGRERYSPGFVYSKEGNLSELNYVRLA